MHPLASWRELRRDTKLAVIALCLAILFATIITVHVLSTAANEVDKAQQDVARIEVVLRREKICSKTNVGDPCRALFDRLAKSLSKGQRFRLGCDALGALDDPELDKIRRASGCPPPLASPPAPPIP